MNNQITNFVSGGVDYQSHKYTEAGTFISTVGKPCQVLVVTQGQLLYDGDFYLESDSYYDICVGTFGQFTSSFSKSQWLDPSPISITAYPSNATPTLDLTLEDGTVKQYGNQPLVIITHPC